MIISVEGKIGAGKSTILDKIKHKPNIVIMQEDISSWTNVNNKGINLFEAYMEDKNKYAFSFQLYNMNLKIIRIEEVLRNNPNAIIVMERSILSDKFMFAELQHELGYIDDISWNIYLDIFNRYSKSTPDIICVLDVEVDTCYERLRKRNRPGEENIDKTYLIHLENRLRLLMNNYKYIKINNEIDLEEVIESVNNHMYT